jgi:hypothetical protein
MSAPTEKARSTATGANNFVAKSDELSSLAICERGERKNCLYFPELNMTMRAQILLFIATMLLAGCSKHITEDSNKVYQNPVDHKAYVAEGGWTTYEPDVPRTEKSNKKVKVEAIRLLTPEEDIAAQTTVEEISAFIKDAERRADESLEKSDKAFQLLVQFSCKPGGHQVKLVHQGDASKELLQRYYDSLRAIKKLPIKQGEVSFQLEISVTP